MSRVFEKILKDFKGTGTEYIQNEDAAKFLVDVFDNALYKFLKSPDNADAPIQKFYSRNQTFWEECLNGSITIGKLVKLQQFKIMEWLPYSPGLFFTERAKESRLKAKQMMNYTQSEFLPLGKMEMMLGGIGSVRLSPQKGDYYLCATSNGISHQGIPLIASKQIYDDIIDEIKHNGFCHGDLIGTVELLPIEKALINYPKRIPKYTIVARDFFKSSSLDNDSLVTIAAVYGDHRIGSAQSWSFSSFKPDPYETNLEQAVEWIETYAKRYGDDDFKILSDFDEHKAHFGVDVEFKLSQVFAGSINEDVLLRYSHKLNITVNKMENNIQHNSGSINLSNQGNVVVGDDNIVDVTGNVTVSNYTSDLAHALTAVGQIVEQQADNVTKDEFELFKEELVKKQPKKERLKRIWDNVVSALPAIKNSVDIFEKISDAIK